MSLREQIDPVAYATVLLHRDAQEVLDRARKREPLDYREVNQAKQLLEAALKYEDPNYGC